MGVSSSVNAVFHGSVHYSLKVFELYFVIRGTGAKNVSSARYTCFIELMTTFLSDRTSK
jgi:hypothetical protein